MSVRTFPLGEGKTKAEFGLIVCRCLRISTALSDKGTLCITLAFIL